MAEPVIERNTPVPIEQSRMFTTFSDYQETVDIRIYQGDHREASENELLGNFEFSGFKKARRGEVSIEVTFEINADGIVSVKACDPETGAQTQMSITLSSGLSDEELETILEENPTARVEIDADPNPVAPVAGTPEPDPGLVALAEDDDAKEALLVDDANVLDPDHQDGNADASHSDELEVLAADAESDDFIDPEGGESDPDALEIEPEALEIGGEDLEMELEEELETVAVMEAVPVQTAGDSVGGDLDTALDGRALPPIEDDGDVVLLEMDAPAEVVMGEPEALAPAGEALAPAGEAIVELAEEEEAVELEVVAEEEVVELQPEPEQAPPSSETVPELTEEPESEINPDDLFDRNNMNLSAGLDED